MYQQFKDVISLNTLSFLNVFFGFLFIIYLSKKFGLNEQSDAVFAGITVVIFLLALPQSLWEALPPHYIKIKAGDNGFVQGLYLQILSLIVLASILIIIFYFQLSKRYFDNMYFFQFMNIYVYFLLLKSLITFNNIILNLNSYFKIAITSDLFVNLTLLISIYFIHPTDLYVHKIAYAHLFATIPAIIMQVYIIIKIHEWKNLKFISNKRLIYIIKSSILIKLGSIIYNFKDIILVAHFSNATPGLYSIYALSLRMASALHRIANAPVLAMYVTSMNNILHNNTKSLGIKLLRQLTKKTILLTLILYLFGSILLFFALPIISRFIEVESMLNLQKFLLLSLMYYFAIVMFYPFYHVLVALHQPMIILSINIIFIILFFVLSKILSDQYLLLSALIFLQLLLGTSLLAGVSKKLKKHTRSIIHFSDLNEHNA